MLLFGEVTRSGVVTTPSGVPGNWRAGRDDLPGMDPIRPTSRRSAITCDQAREVASARLDGAASADEGRDLDHHLAGCATCRAWATAIGTANARLRVGVAETVGASASGAEDPITAILSAIDRERARRRPSMVPMARIALLVVAIAELLGALPGLLGPESLTAHATREHAAFEIALAFGFGWAALRPLAAQGIAVVSTVLSALVVVTSSIDVAEGAVPLSIERGHLVAILGTVLVWLVTHGTPWGRPSGGEHRRLLLPRRHAHA